MSKRDSSNFGFAIVTACGVAAILGGVVLRDRHDPMIFERTGLRGSPLIASTQKDAPTEGNYFDQLSELLEREYVDSIDDKMKLASGAVRGMVMSLADLNSFFYDKDEFAIVVDAMNGSYKGIGADLAFQFPPQKPPTKPDEVAPEQGMPRLTVTAIVPGGPADKAGLKPGDWFDTVDGHWILNSVLIDRARETQAKVLSKEWPASKLDDLRKELRKKLDGNISPLRAWNKLMTGAGNSQVVVFRGSQEMKFTITKGPSKRMTTGSALRPSFLNGSETGFGKAVAGRSTIEFDLRGAGLGDVRVARAYLAKLVAKGKYGTLTRNKKPATAFDLSQGVATSPKITILVDKQTRGVPELFAMVLKSKGATVVGQSAGAPIATEINALPDGSGYTLALGKWTPGGKS